MFWEASSFKPLLKWCLCIHVYWEQIILSDLFIYICYLNNTQQLFSVPCDNESFKCVVIVAPSVEWWILNTQYSRTHLLRPLQKWGKGVLTIFLPNWWCSCNSKQNKKNKKSISHRVSAKTRNNVYLLQFAFQFAWKVRICAGHYIWHLTDRLKTFHLRMSYDLSFNVSVFVYLIVFAFRNELLHVWMTKWNLFFYIGHHTVILCSR